MNNLNIEPLVQHLRKQTAYSLGRPLPEIAQMFIAMGKEKNIDIEIKYGSKKIDKEITIGYFITATKIQKQLFQNEEAIENNNLKNIQQAKEWFEHKLNEIIDYEHRIN